MSIGSVRTGWEWMQWIVTLIIFIYSIEQQVSNTPEICNKLLSIEDKIKEIEAKIGEIEKFVKAQKEPNE